MSKGRKAFATDLLCMLGGLAMGVGLTIAAGYLSQIDRYMDLQAAETLYIEAVHANEQARLFMETAVDFILTFAVDDSSAHGGIPSVNASLQTDYGGVPILNEILMWQWCEEGMSGGQLYPPTVNETVENCPIDCGEPVAKCTDPSQYGCCGDGTCDNLYDKDREGDIKGTPRKGKETIWNCPEDCGWVGDGTCNWKAGESEAYSNAYHGKPTSMGPGYGGYAVGDCFYTNDGVCNVFEVGNDCTQLNSEDAGATCGDGICQQHEVLMFTVRNYINRCPRDCAVRKSYKDLSSLGLESNQLAAVRAGYSLQDCESGETCYSDVAPEDCGITDQWSNSACEGGSSTPGLPSRTEDGVCSIEFWCREGDSDHVVQCTAIETCGNSQDCGDHCGNLYCEADKGENTRTCSRDCFTCGNGICERIGDPAYYPPECKEPEEGKCTTCDVQQVSSIETIFQEGLVQNFGNKTEAYADLFNKNELEHPTVVRVKNIGIDIDAGINAEANGSIATWTSPLSLALKTNQPTFGTVNTSSSNWKADDCADIEKLWSNFDDIVDICKETEDVSRDTATTYPSGTVVEDPDALIPIELFKVDCERSPWKGECCKHEVDGQLYTGSIDYNVTVDVTDLFCLREIITDEGLDETLYTMTFAFQYREEIDDASTIECSDFPNEG